MGIPTATIAGIGMATAGAAEDALGYISDKKKIKRQVSQVKSTQVANYLKSGVLLEGTPQKVIDETDKIGDEKLSDLRTNAIVGGITDLGTNFLSGYTGGSSLSKMFKNFGGV